MPEGLEFVIDERGIKLDPNDTSFEKLIFRGEGSLLIDQNLTLKTNKIEFEESTAEWLIEIVGKPGADGADGADGGDGGPGGSGQIGGKGGGGGKGFDGTDGSKGGDSPKVSIWIEELTAKTLNILVKGGNGGNGGKGGNGGNGGPGGKGTDVADGEQGDWGEGGLGGKAGEGGKCVMAEVHCKNINDNVINVKMQGGSSGVIGRAGEHGEGTDPSKRSVKFNTLFLRDYEVGAEGARGAGANE